MRQFRKSWFFGNFWTFMAIYLLNCSVDLPDEHGDSVPEDLRINDLESVVELILEVGLGMEDAVPEQEDADADQENSIKKNFSLDLTVFCNRTPKGMQVLSCTNKTFSPSSQGGVRPGFFDISSPPPDFS